MEKIFNEYILILVWIGIISFVSTRVVEKKPVLVLGNEVQRYTKAFVIISILPLLFMAANRSIYILDTGAYFDSFNRMPDELSNMQNYLDKYVTKDYAFSILSIIIKCFITKDPNVYFFIIALIQGLCIFIVYRKYSEDFVFTFFLFVISTDYVAWMYNGIRQFTAVVIIFAGSTLFLKKNYIFSFALIYFASLFHRSALIMIPLIIVLQGKAWNKRTLIVIGITIMAIVFIGEFTNLVDTSMQDTQYQNVVTDYQIIEDDGTNPIRVLVYSVPTIIAFIGRKEIIETDNRIVHFCTNASIVSTGIYVISIFTSGIYFGRMPIYLSLYNYILLPWEIKHIIPEDLKKPVLMALIVFYAVFYYYQISITWGFF